MRKVILIILGVIMLAGSVFIAKWLIDSKNKPKPVAKNVVKTVFVDTVKNGTIPIVIPANGNLTAVRKIELYAEVQGVMLDRGKVFKPGKAYKKGELLIDIDASEFNASLISQKSSLYNLITAVMPDLRLDYPEAYPNWEQYLKEFDLQKQVPPLPKPTSDKENFFITGQNIVSSYYTVKNLEERYIKYRISAPFDGILTEALVNPGTLIRSGQKLGEFIDTSLYELEVAVSKSYGDLLVTGKKVKLHNLEHTRSWTGEIVRINGKVDLNSQTIDAYIYVSGKGLREGMYLEAQLLAKEEPNSIEISRKLLVDNNSGVYVVEDTLLRLAPVTPVFFSEKTAIVKGLKDGDIILNKSVPGAYSGMLVKVHQLKDE